MKLQSMTAILAAATFVALAACGSGEQPATQVQPANAPAASSTGEATSPVDSLGAAVRTVLDGDFEAHYFDAVADLNGDGAPEAIVYVAGPMVCGTGGCNLLVFTTGPDGYRLVSSISVARPPVRIAPRSSQGWRNLVVGVGGGGGEAGNAELKFDGKAYPANPTVSPAEPLSDLAGSEVLIAEFGTYKEGKPVPPQVYGDVKLPVAGEVLGMAIHTQDAEELRYVVLQKLTDRYAAEKGIDVTQQEKSDYIDHLRAVLAEDPNFQGAAPSAADSAEDQAAREYIAAAFIKQWKLNRALHQQYGGRIIFQQGGPEPLDAYRKFLEESAARGDFRVLNKDLDAEFWRYYRDESIHQFYKSGSTEEAQAFDNPPWALPPAGHHASSRSAMR